MDTRSVFSGHWSIGVWSVVTGVWLVITRGVVSGH